MEYYEVNASSQEDAFLLGTFVASLPVVPGMCSLLRSRG